MKKSIKYFLIFSLFIFLIMFFFKVLPVPVENIAGAKDPDNFIYGGIHWVSLGSEAKLGNYMPLLSFLLIDLSLIGGIKLWAL